MNPVFRDNLLEGQTAYITGGSSGICFGIAQTLVKQGARVAIQGRRPEKLASAVAALGPAARGHAADVRDYAATAAAIRATAEEWGPIDILVAGAAGNFPARAAELSPNGFKAVVDIDLLGTFHTCRAAYAFLRKPGASVIAISATHAFQPYALQAHVCAAKAGVDRLVQVLALEWGREGVRCNIIAPGPVDETEGMRRLAPTQEARAAIAQAVPLGRFARIEEIAQLALFLSTPAAAYITGAVLVADGGASLAGRGLPFQLPS